MRKAISAVIIENKKILLVRKKRSWILPGGKLESGESELACLCREVSEELSGTKLQSFQFYEIFEGTTPHSKRELQAVVYFARLDGELGEPSAEINEAKWVQDVSRYNFSDITSKIINALKRDNYL